MAKLLKKKHLINSSGEEELLDIYTTKVEATQSRLPCKSILVDIDGQMTTCYIGLTDELDTPKCSSKRVQIDDKTYAERKYMGMVNFNDYMRNTYPDTYKTMTEIPEQLPDTSDCTTAVSFFEGMSKLSVPTTIDLRNCNNIKDLYYNCSEMQGSLNINNQTNAAIISDRAFFNNSKITDIKLNEPFVSQSCTGMFTGCSILTKQIKIDTSKCSSLNSLYSNNINAEGDFVVDGNMATNLARTFFHCEKAKNIIINNPNSSIYTVREMLEGCTELKTVSELYTGKCTDFGFMYAKCKNLTTYQDLDTSSGMNFESMYASSNIITIPNINTLNGQMFNRMFAYTNITECNNINTENGIYLAGMFDTCQKLNVVSNLNTKYNRMFSNMFCDNISLTSINDIDLSSCDKETNFTYMLRQCNQLNKVTFNNAPLTITVDELRKTTLAPETLTINLNYRTIRNNISPIKIIKASGMKLIDIDEKQTLPIVTAGNKTLEECIVHSGDYGTIYDDGEYFRCFVTKDNLIYVGKTYDSTTRKPEQPEIPEGITVPNGCIILRNTKFNSIKDFSFIQYDASSIHRGNEIILKNLGIYLKTIEAGTEKYYSTAFIQGENNQKNLNILNSAYCNKAFNETYSKKFDIQINNNFTHIGIADVRVGNGLTERFQESFRQINFYDTQLFSEELEEQLNKIKNGTTAHRIIKSKTVDVQGQPRQRLVDIDTDGDSPIRINGVAGTYNLDDYIVYDTEWGTIYSDGAVTVQNLAPNTLQEYTIALEELENIQSNPVSLHSNETYTPFDFNNQQDYSNLINDINNSSLKRMSQEEINQLSTSTIPTPIQFGVTIFKDGTIYLGKAYLNTDMLRGRPEPPEGILVPNSALSISKSFDKEDMSIVFKDLLFTSTPTGAHQPLIYCNTGSSNYWLSFGDENNRTSSCAYSGIYREELKKNSSTFVSGNKNTFYFTVKDFFGSGHDEYFGAKELKLWNRNLTKEELLLEKEPVIAMSVTRDENNPSPELTYTEELL